MLRVSFHGFMKAMYSPSGESCAPEISGSPKINSRSMIGGRSAICDPKLANFRVTSQSDSRFLDGPADFGAGQSVYFTPPAFLQAGAGGSQFLGAKSRVAHELRASFRKPADQTCQLRGI